MLRPSRFTITLPPRDPQYVRALYQTRIYNLDVRSQEAHESRERARRKVARTTEPRSAIAQAVVHNLHVHRQIINTRRVGMLAKFDVPQNTPQNTPQNAPAPTPAPAPITSIAPQSITPLQSISCDHSLICFCN